jgi:hypothetical protein
MPAGGGPTCATRMQSSSCTAAQRPPELRLTRKRPPGFEESTGTNLKALSPAGPSFPWRSHSHSGVGLKTNPHGMKPTDAQAGKHRSDERRSKRGSKRGGPGPRSSAARTSIGLGRRPRARVDLPDGMCSKSSGAASGSAVQDPVFPLPQDSATVYSPQCSLWPPELQTGPTQRESTPPPGRSPVTPARAGPPPA